MKCPFCTAENAHQANFCSNCGSPLNLLACPHCERINEKNTATCMNCGKALPDPEIEATAELVESNLPEDEKTDWRELLKHIEEEIDRLDARTAPSAVTKVEVEPVEVEPRPPTALALSPTDNTITIEQLTSTAEPKKFAKLALLFVVSGAFALYLFLSLPPKPHPIPAATPSAIAEDEGRNSRVVLSPAEKQPLTEETRDAAALGASTTVASLFHDGQDKQVPAEPLLIRLQSRLTSLNAAQPKTAARAAKKPPSRGTSAKRDEWNGLVNRLY